MSYPPPYNETCGHVRCRGLTACIAPRHVTGTKVYSTAWGTMRGSVTLTDTGKPLEPTEEPEHVLSGVCWCQPLVETDIVTGSHLFIHRRSLDSPHIEAAS